MELFAYLQIAQAYEEFEAEDLVTINRPNYRLNCPTAFLMPTDSSQSRIGILLTLTAVWSTTLTGAAMAVEEFDPGFRPGASSTFVPVSPSNTSQPVSVNATGCANALCRAACGSTNPPVTNLPIVPPVSDNGTGNNPGNNFVPVRPLPAGGVFLRRGDVGPEITRLQNLLRSAGYFDAASTGFFASLTETGVRAFQRDRGLPVDGIVGEETLTALQGFRPVSPTPLPAPIPQPGVNQLQIGDRGPNVAKLQLALRDTGFFRGAIDGVYAAQTEQAVIAYQQATGLPVSGIADSLTLAQLGVSFNQFAAQ